MAKDIIDLLAPNVRGMPDVEDGEMCEFDISLPASFVPTAVTTLRSPSSMLYRSMVTPLKLSWTRSTSLHLARNMQDRSVAAPGRSLPSLGLSFAEL
jgi:hypothetical protein